MCGQREDKFIHDYPQRLQLLAKVSSFKTADAAQIRDDCVRDAFISSLHFNFIRQSLLVKATVDLQTAIHQSRAVYLLQKF